MDPATPPSNLNIANVLTVVRIAGVPLFGWLLLTQDGDSVQMRVWAWVAFGALMITDKIDGDLGRKDNLVTNFGKLADPIADKALTGMAFVGLSIIGQLWWWVTILVLVREWGITLMRLWVIRHGVLAANRGGKLKTVLQTLALGLFILPLRLLPGGWDVVGQVLWWLAALAMAAAVSVALVTGVDYVIKALSMRRDGRSTVEAG